MIENIAFVLKSGGDFDPGKVFRLSHNLDEMGWGKGYHVFSDMGRFDGCYQHHDLKYNLPGWWSKMELFEPGRLPSGSTLYIDLDTIIVGSIRDIIRARYERIVYGIRDFYNPEVFASGMMVVPDGGSLPLWTAFRKFAMHDSFKFNRHNGDQEFIRSHVAHGFIDDQIPDGQIVSYKRDCLTDQTGLFYRVPDGATVVCFHGQPRPWDTPMWDDYAPKSSNHAA